MYDICAECGEYTPDKHVDRTHGTIECPNCGYSEPLVFGKLLLIGGSSGVGKSTVCRKLAGTIEGVVVLDCDSISVDNSIENDEEKWHHHYESTLRICRAISQSGLTVAAFGSGIGVPMNAESAKGIKYFGAVHYLSLVCDDRVMRDRIRARPDWREQSDSHVEQLVQFNQWIKNPTVKDIPPIDLIDTSRDTIDHTCELVRKWIISRCRGNGCD